MWQTAPTVTKASHGCRGPVGTVRAHKDGAAMTRNTKSAWMSAMTMGTVAFVAGCGAERDEADVTSRSGALSSSSLIATATLGAASDLAPFTDPLENGLPQNVLGGIGSGLTWAGGTTFLGVPDRGPNATTYDKGILDDNTTSFISRFETLDLALVPASSGTLPFTLTPRLQATTLLFSDQPLVYGAPSDLPSAVPPANSADHFYFSGRSDNFGAGLSTNASFARLDPE